MNNNIEEEPAFQLCVCAHLLLETHVSGSFLLFIVEAFHTVHLLTLSLDLLLKLILFQLCCPSLRCRTPHLAFQVVQFGLHHTRKEG